MSGLTGAREMKAVLDKLPAELRKAALRKAALAGARVWRDAAKAAAPRRLSGGPKKRAGKSTPPGFLAAQIKSAVVRAASDDGRVTVEVGPGRRAFYGLFLEFGRKAAGSRLKVRRRPLGGRRKNIGTRAILSNLVKVGGRKRAVSAMTARPWFASAIEGSAPAALDAMGRTLGAESARSAEALAGRFLKSGLATRRGGLRRLLG